MGKVISTNFDPGVPAPLDSRTQVSTYANLAFIPIKFIGLKCYVVDEDKEYRYYSTGWQAWTGDTGASGTVWGSITGDITLQTDLSAALLLKFDKVGGTITGETTVTADVYGWNFILTNSEPSVGALSIPDAPADGPQYARQNGLWTEIVPYVPPVIATPTGLEYIDTFGWSLIDRTAANYAAIGVSAVDLSTSGQVGSFGAFGISSFTGGFETKANNYGVAFGYKSEAGPYALALGMTSIASGTYASAINDRTSATGNASGAFGSQTKAKSWAEFVVGSNNTDYTPGSLVAWSSTDRAFVVGIGVNQAAPKDGLIVFKTGLVTAPELSDAVINTGGGNTLVTKSWVQNNPATVGIFSAYEVTTIETLADSSRYVVSHSLGVVPLFWMFYLECKQTTTIGGRSYVAGSRLSIPQQHNAENDDLRGMQIEPNSASYVVMVTTLKAFGTSYSAGTNGANIDLSYWRLRIVGVI